MQAKSGTNTLYHWPGQPGLIVKSAYPQDILIPESSVLRGQEPETTSTYTKDVRPLHAFHSEVSGVLKGTSLSHTGPLVEQTETRRLAAID